MSRRRDKKRIEPDAPASTAAERDADASRRRRRKDRRREDAAGVPTSMDEALAALTGEVPLADPAAGIGSTPEAEEIAALTTRHRTGALEPSGRAVVAPRMRAFRLPAIVVVIACLVAAALIERGAVEPTVVATAPADLARLAPVASAPGAQSSTFYCAGGTARGSTDPVEAPVAEEPVAEDPAAEEPAVDPSATVPTPAGGVTDPTEPAVPVVAEHTVTIANFSDIEQRATVTAVPSVGDPVVHESVVAPRTRVTIKLADLVIAPFASALVETDGGSVAVEHEVAGPTGRSFAPSASSASSTWYFPAGTTRLGTRLVYAVFNPFPQQAVVDFAFMVEEDGGRQITRRSDQLEGIVVPAGRVVAVDITDIVTVGNQLATTVTTRSGLGRVVVDQLQVSDGRSDWPENLSLVLGAPAPSTTWLFADNRPLGDGVSTSFVAFNPGPTDAEVEIYAEVDGQALAPVVEPFIVTVRAGQYAQVPLGQDTRIPAGFGAFVVAVSRNDVPIVVERVTVQSVPLDPVGAVFTIGSPVVARDWLVPVGGADGQSAMQVSIANPSVSETATLTVEAVGEGNAGALEQFDAVTLAPGARTVVDLAQAQGAAALMLRITASTPVVVAQWLGFADPGTLSDTAAFPVAGTLVVPGGEIVDRADAPEVTVAPADGVPPGTDGLEGTLREGTTPGTEVAPEETTTTAAPVETAPPVTDPATGLPVDPAVAPTTVATVPTTVAPG